MLSATKEETEEVVSYFEWQAPDLTITFLQKVYSEAVIGHRHDVWDIHTNKDRWWVITNPTNLYSQDQFPNMDLAVTFHMGLCLRIPRTQRQRRDDSFVRSFGNVLTDLSSTSDALAQAQSVADYQAIGVRCREALLSFIAAAQDAHPWGHEVWPKRADFRAWTDIICNEALPGDAHKERRQLMKALLSSSWTFTNWLTHTKSTTWADAETALTTVEHVLGLAISLVIRHSRGVPEQCPECGSPHLSPEQGVREDIPDVVWERPICDDCGWQGSPVKVADEGGLELITREGGDDSEECAIMNVPLRGIKKPGDE
jgi:hypothetical protein